VSHEYRDFGSRVTLIDHLHGHPDHAGHFPAGHDFFLVSTTDVAQRHRREHAEVKYEEKEGGAVTPEEETEACQRTISECNAVVRDRIAVRRAAERELAALEARIEFVILAARHLDPTEGVMCAGHVVTGADIMAVRTVLGFVSAHKDCELTT
jgi:hypothetical protein